MLNFSEELYLNGTNFNKELLSNTSLVSNFNLCFENQLHHLHRKFLSNKKYEIMSNAFGRHQTLHLCC